MAGTKSDGSITIDTKLDNSGFSKGSEELRHAVKSLTDQVNATGGKIQNAFKFDFGQPKQAVNSFSRAIKQVNDEIQSLGELGQQALEGDADALARFRTESGETLSKLEEMKAELEKFGSTEFMTPEYEKAAGQYQKAATQVDELSKSLENAEAAFEQLTNDFGSSEEYTALEDRIEVLKMYQKEYEAAMKRGDSGAAARAFMDAGVGKGTIADAIKEAEAEMEKLWDKFENSTPYKSTQREIDKITAKLEQAKAQAEQYKAEMDATPATFEGYASTEYERDQAALERTIDRLLEYRQMVREGVGSDTAPSAEWTAMQERWQNMTSVTGVLRNAFTSLFSTISSGARTVGSAVAMGIMHPFQLLDRTLAGVISTAGRAVWSLTKLAAGGIATGIRKIAEAAKSAAAHLASMAKGAITSGLKKLGNAISNVGKHSKKTNVSLAGGFKTMLKYGLGIRSLFVLFNKLRSAITEGFGTLAKYDGQFNQTMSNFKNSMERLKNSFAGAFAPLAEAILPVITAAIDKVSAALSKLGQLFAALTGKNYFMEATKGTTDYAESLDKSSKNTKKQKKESKELQRTLAGFDDVEILKENKNNDDDSEDPDTSGGFSQIPISGAMKDLADWLKKMWDMADFTELGRRLGEGLKNALDKIPWDYIKQVAAKLGKSLATLLNGFLEVPGLFTTIGKTIAEGINTIFEFLDAFASNFHWASLGQAIKDGILGLLNNIDWPLIYHTMATFGAGIGTALETALNNPEIWTAIFTAISNGLNSLIYGIDAFLTAVDWASLGANIGTGLNAGVEAYDWDALSQTLIHLINGAFDLWYNFVTTFDFYKFGSHIGTALSTAVKGINWTEGGASVAQTINGLFEALNGFIQSTDWKALGAAVIDAIGGFFGEIDWGTMAETLSSAAIGLLNALTGAFQEVDWKSLPGQIVEAIKSFLTEFDWTGVATAAGELIGAAFTALIEVGGELWESMKAVGKNIMEGGFQGIKDALASVGEWIKTNIFDPFIAGFKSVFGIESPSTEMMPLGGYIIEGMLKGIIDGLASIGTWIKENIVDPFVAGVKSMFGLDGEESVLVSVGKDLIAGLKVGIGSVMSGISEWIQTVITDPFINGIKSLFGLDGEESVLVSVGKNLIAGLKAGIGGVMSGINEWIQTVIVDPFVGGIKSLFGLDGEESVLVSVGKNLLEGLKSGLLGAMDGVGDWIDTNITGPICGFFKSLFGIASPSTVFSEYGGYLLEGLKSGLLAAMDGVGDWISTNVTGPICGFFKDLFGINSPSTVFSEYGGYLMEGLEDGIDTNKELPKTALSDAQTSMETVFSTQKQLLAWAKVGSNVMSLGLRAGILLKTPAVLATVTKLEDDMRKVITKNFTNWKTAAGTLLENFKQGLSGKQSTLVNTVNTIITSLKTKIDSFRSGMSASGRELMTQLESGMNGVSSSIASSANSIATGIYNSFNSQNWSSLGSYIGQGIYNGLSSSGGSLETLAWNTAVNMYNSACRALGIASPSKEFAWIGEMITEGLGGGISATQDNAVDAVTSLADAVTKEAEGTSPFMQIDTAVSGLDSVLSTFSDKVVNSFNAMISAMENIVSGSSLMLPAMANGSVMPYSARRSASQGEADKLSTLIETLAQRDADRLTRDDLNEILVNALRQYLNIDFYIGDEQIARHANAGNARLNRRYSTT